MKVIKSIWINFAFFIGMILLAPISLMAFDITVGGVIAKHIYYLLLYAFTLGRYPKAGVLETVTWHMENRGGENVAIGFVFLVAISFVVIYILEGGNM